MPHFVRESNRSFSKLGIQGFTASNDWIDHFKKKHNLFYKSICGEFAGDDSESNQEWMENTLLCLIQEYFTKEIFYANEIGLCYNLLPDKIFAIKCENCNGGKLSKLRLTFYCVMDSDMNEKITHISRM